MEVLEEASSFASGSKLVIEEMREIVIEEVRGIKWHILPMT